MKSKSINVIKTRIRKKKKANLLLKSKYLNFKSSLEDIIVYLIFFLGLNCKKTYLPINYKNSIIKIHVFVHKLPIEFHKQRTYQNKLIYTIWRKKERT